MKNIIGKVRFDAQTKITNGNFINADYSQNSEYIAMLEQGNFIDVTQEQYDFIRSNNNNGIDVCVIDGKLQVYVMPESEKLEKAKASKLVELQIIYKDGETWNFTLKDVDSSIRREQNWLKINLSNTSWFYDENNNEVEKQFTDSKVLELKYKIIIKGKEISDKFTALKSQINLCTSLSELNEIDIQGEFEKINKIIEIS